MKKRTQPKPKVKRQRPAKPNSKWKSLVDTAEYFGVVPMTVRRWYQDEKYRYLKFPQPSVVNDRCYWEVEILDAWMRSRVGLPSSRVKEEA